MTLMTPVATFGSMKTTRYFDEQVIRKRPYIRQDWCETALAEPLRRETQSDGRIRHWVLISDTRDNKPRILRVVTLDDGETTPNAFFDRDFPRK
jgi:hypothetical protein